MRIFSLLVCLFASINLNSQVGYQFTIDSDSGADGTYQVTTAANYGPSRCDFGSFSGVLELVQNSDGDTEACNGIEQDLTGKIALVDRGVCWHDIKTKAAQEQGAIAMIMCDYEGSSLTPLFKNFDTPDEDLGVTIPSFKATFNDCNIIKANIADGLTLNFEPIFVTDPSPGTPLFFEDFSSGLGNWENIGLISEVPEVSPQNALWTYTPDGSTSKFTNLPSYIISESACNGAAIFDFVLYAGDNSTGLQLSGDLISPTIDFSDNGPVILKFTQWNLPLNGGGNIDANSVSYTLDDGANWSEPLFIETENVFSSLENNIVGSEFVKIALPELAGQSNVKIKFTASGDFYYWIIDDISIEELTGRDALMSKPLYPNFSHSFPSSMQASQAFEWTAAVNNLGGEVLDDLALNVKITNIDNGLEYYNENFNSPESIELSEFKDITFGSYIPDDNLDLGEYRIDYEISLVNGNESDLSNNKISEYFEVTNNYFAKENGENINYSNLQSNGGYTVLTGYQIPDISGLQATNAVFSVQAPEGIVDFTDDNYVHIYLLKIKDGLGLDEIDQNELDLFSHPSLELISDNFVTLGAYSSQDIITAPFDIDESPIDLEANGFYFIAAEYDEENIRGLGGFPNSQMRHSFNSNPDYSSGTGLSWLFNTSLIVKDDFWYSVGFGTDTPAMLRLQTNLSTSANDIPLLNQVMTISPNPSSGVLYVDFNANEIKAANIFLTDLDGKIIKHLEHQGALNNRIIIDLSNYPDGTYFVKIISDDKSETQKIILLK